MNPRINVCGVRHEVPSVSLLLKIFVPICANDTESCTVSLLTKLYSLTANYPHLIGSCFLHEYRQRTKVYCETAPGLIQS